MSEEQLRWASDAPIDRRKSTSPTMAESSASSEAANPPTTHSARARAVVPAIALAVALLLLLFGGVDIRVFATATASGASDFAGLVWIALSGGLLVLLAILLVAGLLGR